MVLSFVKTVGWLARGFGFLGQAAVVCMVVTICYDVVMRYVFKAPTKWSLEINTFLLIFITLIPAAEVLREDGHLKIGFFISKFGPGFQRVTRRISAVLGLALCSLMVYNGWNMAHQAFQYDQRMSTPLGTPMVIPYLFIPVGFAALGLQFIVRLFEPQSKADQPQGPPERDQSPGLRRRGSDHAQSSGKEICSQESG